jgi:F-type H+-transporting ATPase subunit gamma
MKDEENNRAYILVVSSDKGLCGGYNSGLVKQVSNFIKENPQTDFKLFYIGKKVRDVIQNEFNSDKTFTFEKAEPSFDEVRKVADELSAAFTNGEIGKVYIAYNSFQSVISTIPTVHKVLPLKMEKEDAETLKAKYPFDFKYEPAPEQILETLIPEVYITTVYTALLDAIAAEHASRMNAMENATKNCKEMIRKLTLKMNKLRQAAITTELIEVVSGAESLNG